MVVVLPAPFGPRNAKISPARTSNETSLTAVTAPNDLTMCWTRMMGRSLTTLEHHGLNGVRPRIDLDRGPADGEVIRSALCHGVHDDHDHLPVVVYEARREQHAAARRRQDPASARTDELREVADIVVRVGVDQRAGSRVGVDRRNTEIADVVGTAPLIEQNIPVGPSLGPRLELVYHRPPVRLAQAPAA